MEKSSIVVNVSLPAMPKLEEFTGSPELYGQALSAWQIVCSTLARELGKALEKATA